MADSKQIRSVCSDDLELLLSWRNHPGTRRFMFNQKVITMLEHQQWFEHALQQEDRQLLIYEVAGVPLGYMNFTNAVANGVSEWGFYVAPDAPKGSGTSMGRMMLNYAFSNIEVFKVCGEVLDYNSISVRLHEKLGFVREGVMRQQHPINDHYYDVIYFGMLRQEWIELVDRG